MDFSLLIVIGREPYDGTDTVWNALRLAKTALREGTQVRLFLINDGVNLAREGTRPEGSEFDLTGMLLGLVKDGIEAKICQTCLNRCGIGRGEVVKEAEVAGMKDLFYWIKNSDKVISF